MEQMYPLAAVMLEEDQLLNRMRFDLVPKLSVLPQHLCLTSHHDIHLQNQPRWNGWCGVFCVRQCEGGGFLEELFLPGVSDQAVSSAHSAGSPAAAEGRWGQRGQCFTWGRRFNRSDFCPCFNTSRDAPQGHSTCYASIQVTARAAFAYFVTVHVTHKGGTCPVLFPSWDCHNSILNQKSIEKSNLDK